MHTMNRRQFLLRSAGAVAATVAAPHLAWAETATGFDPFAVKVLGKTGIETSYLGMGTGTNGWGKNSDQQRQGLDYFNDLLIAGYERGVRYFDLADQYGSHDNMARAIKDGRMDRSKLLLLTKSTSRDAEGMAADIERFRQELDTDYLDAVLLHCLTEGGWTESMEPVMDVLTEAKAKGHIRAHGVSCHNLDAMKDASESPWVDIMLSRINPYGLSMDGTVEEVVAVLEKAHANGKGMLGMKIAGGAPMEPEKLSKSLEFVLDLDCIDAITMGFVKQDEFADAIARIEAVTA